MTIEADRLSKIEDHCQGRLRDLATLEEIDARDRSQVPESQAALARAASLRATLRAEIATILNLVRGISIVLAFLAGCATEPVTPSCASLGADPSAPLLCSRDGLCTFHGEACTRGHSLAPAGSGSAGSGQTTGSDDPSGATCTHVVGACAPCDDFAAWATANATPGHCAATSCANDSGGASDFQACLDGAP